MHRMTMEKGEILDVICALELAIKVIEEDYDSSDQNSAAEKVLGNTKDRMELLLEGFKQEIGAVS